MENSEEYINVEDALKRVGGNMGLYKRLLGRFTDEDHIAPLEEALNTGNAEEAAHLAHTIKGVSANLSLIKLAASAADLEHKIKDGADHSEIFSELKQVYAITSDKVAEIM